MQPELFPIEKYIDLAHGMTARSIAMGRYHCGNRRSRSVIRSRNIYGGKIMKRISFTLTISQVRGQTKTITRRLGWDSLNVGDRLQPIEKGMGLKKGESQVLLGDPIEVVSIRKEPISAITQSDVIAEGFPLWTPTEFIAFICSKNKCRPDTIVNRIEFKYLAEEQE